MKTKIPLLLLITSVSSICTYGTNDYSKPTVQQANSQQIALKNKTLMTTSSIQRDKNTKKATFISTLTDKWSLYAGPSIDQIDRSKPLLTGKGSGTFLLDIPTDQRYYFELRQDNRSLILSDKHLPMEGGFNFRDLGGYKTKDNQIVKWGKIFRSDDLANLTATDLTYLSSIPLHDVLDFRSPDEIKAGPDKRPQSLQNYIQLSITPGNLTDLTTLNASQIDEVMKNINREIISDPASIKQYREMFALLQNPSENTPLLYHCTAGKDRTGMATALILFALGVDQQVVFEDYLLSNQYIKEKFADYIKEKPELESLFSVKREFLQAGLDKIVEENGSIENFLTQKLEVDLVAFKQLYLN